MYPIPPTSHRTAPLFPYTTLFRSRPENFAARLIGRRVERIQRRAKYMRLHLDDGQVLLCHLGMSGRMVIVKRARGGRRPPLDRHDHIVFVTEAGAEIRFNDARRFGIMDLGAAEALDTHPLLRALGPEPLGTAFQGPSLAAALKGKRRSEEHTSELPSPMRT